ncbi:MAG: TolB family protein [Ardenticatenaceae bacterium]
MKRTMFVLLALLFTIPFWSMVIRAAPTKQQPACLFFTETVDGEGGFSVCDNDQAHFRTAFEAWGLQKIGYPISQRYSRDGFVTQAFQKAIMQWRSESEHVVLANIFDDLHNDGFDETLFSTRQTPPQLPAGWDGDVSFTKVIERRQMLLDVRPALRDAYLASNDPLTFYGLPTSEIQDMGNHYAIRTQRAVLQEWKEDVPWAKTGDVTIANGGDIAKELGALPAEALLPETSASELPSGPIPAPPTPPAPQPTATPETTLSPDIGGTILLTSNRSKSDECYTMNVDGSNVRRLTTFGFCYDAHFTADGSKIVFTHKESEEAAFDIWIMNVDGTSPINLTNTPDQNETYPVASPNGQKIAYLLSLDNRLEIHTMNMDGSQSTPITTGSFDLMQVWSPDSQKIVFSSARSGFFNIWTVNADGTNLTPVTTFERNRAAIWPHISDDGQQIAFLTISQTSVWDIWQTNLNGNDPSPIAEAVVTNRTENPIFAAWRQGQFLIGTGGNDGDWDPYFIAESEGEPIRVRASQDNDTPSDWLP